MIRESTASDMAAILSIWLESSIKAHDFVPPEYWKSKVNDMREIYIPSSDTYVFEDNGRILGFISICGDVLAAIFVTPEQQGHGIGSALLDFVKARRASLSLCVYKANTASIAFYERHGFVAVGEQTDEHTGHPEIRMRLDT